MIGLGASLALLESLGMGPISEAILQWSDRACDRMAEVGAVIASPREPAMRSGIVAFELPGRQPEQVRRACRDARIAVACRGGRIRISGHAYNNDDDLDRLISVLKSF